MPRNPPIKSYDTFIKENQNTNTLTRVGVEWTQALVSTRDLRRCVVLHRHNGLTHSKVAVVISDGRPVCVRAYRLAGIPIVWVSVWVWMDGERVH